MGQLIASPPLYEKLKDELRDYIGGSAPGLLPAKTSWSRITGCRATPCGGRCAI